MSAAVNGYPVSTSEIVVLDVGRQKRKAVNELKQGIGPLSEEMHVAVRAAAVEQGKADKDVLPVVIVYEKKSVPKRRGLVRKILSSL